MTGEQVYAGGVGDERPRAIDHGWEDVSDREREAGAQSARYRRAAVARSSDQSTQQRLSQILHTLSRLTPSSTLQTG
jgi:hypothetical protein